MPPLTHSPVGFSGPTSQVWTTPFPHALGERARDKDGNEYQFVQFDVAAAGSGILVSITPNGHAAPLLNTSLLTGRIGVAMTTMAANDGGWVQVYGLAVVQGGGQDNASTDVASLTANTGVSVSEADLGSITPRPQLVVTTPTGTLGLYSVGSSDENVLSSLTSLSSNLIYGNINRIFGMYLLTATDVSNLPDAMITSRYNTVTSPVSAVSNTSGPVTLTTRATSHHGGEFFVYLNYPYVAGERTS